MLNKIENTVQEFSDKGVLENLSDETREELVNHRAKVMLRNDVKNKKSRYSKKNPKHKLYFRTGCDLLQFNIVVRPFIIKKFNIENPDIFDVLLYLFPIQFFTMPDFRFLPLKNLPFKYFREQGYIETSLESLNKGKNVYRLTDLSQKIVTEYYEYLSGEKTIRKGSYKNPFHNQESTKIDALREEVMLKLKRMSETRTSKFGNSFY
jgi:hypothetical protein